MVNRKVNNMKNKVARIKPNEIKTVIYSVAGYYFSNVNATPLENLTKSLFVQEDETNDTIAVVKLKLEDLGYMQQFVILYFLLLQHAKVNCNFDFIIKYRDGYGVNGKWMKQDASFDHRQQNLLDNMINQHVQIGELLDYTINALHQDQVLKPNNDPDKTILDDIAEQALFLNFLLPVTDLQDEVAKLVDLGWNDQYFIYNQAVDQAVDNLIKPYPKEVVDQYTLIINDDKTVKKRLAIKKSTMKYLINHDPKYLESCVDHLFNIKEKPANFAPIWIDYDYQTKDITVKIPH